MKRILTALCFCLSFEAHALDLQSQSIQNFQLMKSDFICTYQQGGNQSPQLSIQNVPKNAQSLLLIMHDPDAMKEGGYVHWIVYIDNPQLKQLAFNQKVTAKDDFVYGKNDSDQNAYYGPCPPAGSGLHRYNFTLYALDTKFDKAKVKNMHQRDFINKLNGHVLDQAVLTGFYRNRE